MLLLDDAERSSNMNFDLLLPVCRYLLSSTSHFTSFRKNAIRRRSCHSLMDFFTVAQIRTKSHTTTARAGLDIWTCDHWLAGLLQAWQLLCKVAGGWEKALRRRRGSEKGKGHTAGVATSVCKRRRLRSAQA